MSRLWLVCVSECVWDWREVTVCDAIGPAWDENLDRNGTAHSFGKLIKCSRKCGPSNQTHMFEVPGRRMTVNEAVLSIWRMAHQDDLSRSEMLAGVKPAYGTLNQGLKKARKKRKAKNDGCAPDSNATLFRQPKTRFFHSKKTKSQAQLWQSHWRLTNIKWLVHRGAFAFRTCISPTLAPWILSCFWCVDCTKVNLS